MTHPGPEVNVVLASTTVESWRTVKSGNFGRWGNFVLYQIFDLGNIFCHLKNNLAVNMEVKGYSQSAFCLKRGFMHLDTIAS